MLVRSVRGSVIAVNAVILLGKYKVITILVRVPLMQARMSCKIYYKYILCAHDNPSMDVCIDRDGSVSYLKTPTLDF